MSLVKFKYSARFAKNNEQVWIPSNSEVIHQIDGPKCLLPGLEILLQKMATCEGFTKLHAFVATKWAHGPLLPVGNPIVQGADLLFEIELLEHTPPPKSFMSLIQVYSFTALRKDQGNELIKNSNCGSGPDHLKALRRYNEGIEAFTGFLQNQCHGGRTEKVVGVSTVEDAAIDDKHTNETLRQLQLNAALCYLKTKDFKNAISMCDKVLEIDAFNLKALYRRGLAYEDAQNYCSADRDFRSCLMQQEISLQRFESHTLCGDHESDGFFFESGGIAHNGDSCTAELTRQKYAFSAALRRVGEKRKAQSKKEKKVFHSIISKMESENRIATEQAAAQRSAAEEKEKQETRQAAIARENNFQETWREYEVRAGAPSHIRKQTDDALGSDGFGAGLVESCSGAGSYSAQPRLDSDPNSSNKKSDVPGPPPFHRVFQTDNGSGAGIRQIKPEDVPEVNYKLPKFLRRKL